VALLTDKEQPVLRAVLPAGMATAWTALAGVVGIYRDTDATCQGGFVGEQSAQFGKRPASGMAIGVVCFGRHGDKLFPFAALFATFGAFAMPVRSSRPIRAWGWVSRMCLAMV
jgi:hypothetical protein